MGETVVDQFCQDGDVLLSVNDDGSGSITSLGTTLVLGKDQMDSLIKVAARIIALRRQSRK